MMKEIFPWEPPESLSAFGVKVLVWFLAILSPIYDVMGAVIVLVLIDFATGVGAAMKIKEAVSSRKMRNTVNKFLFYTLTIIAAHIVETKITSSLPWLKLVSGFIAITELRSIFENFNRIFSINIWDFIKEILKQTKAGETFFDAINKSKKPKDEN